MFLFKLRIPLAPAAVLVAALSLGGCGTVAGWVTPYKIDILQGNVITREQVQALQPGMPREQVRDIMGSPLLASVFHADRWDYVFTLQRRGQEPQSRRVSVFFKDGGLARHEADDLPSEAEFVASLDARRDKNSKVPPLEATEEQLKAFAERNKPQAPPLPASAAPAPSTTQFPPLEPAR
ncbi:MAG TPA: outer membrane protein assembly factor BamE [Hydrogenophaga sp.]|uniref:outer membrane protein assembly factor BamE n=1 Tax=Hydrogenophaga sp. TaxID=1904254 RepID=UPI002CD850D8|nr:outer membrane protein assembly factor BamE [Hydrogenophaga sp.]HSX93617.1 outer membrane protein assembly factor BamE [Hydrogenophaga sp.]